MEKRTLHVSLITTVWNEGRSIGRFLDSILSQTVLPAEMVIVDGGSADQTVPIMEDFAKRHPEAGLRIIKAEERINIAKGRNIAISAAAHPVIAATDAGCTLSPDWLEKIVEPLLADSEVDVVSGWYEPWVETRFEAKVAEAIFPTLKEIDPAAFAPSSRSIAFRKAAWKKAGGYPEWLTLSAEDTLFDFNLRKAGCKFVFRPQAVVKWRPRGTWKSLMWINFSMGRGDGEARLLFPNYLYKAACLFVPVLFGFTKKGFRSLGIRYVLSWAAITGWVWGTAKGIFQQNRGGLAHEA